MPPQYNQMIILFILIYVFDSIILEIYNEIKQGVSNCYNRGKVKCKNQLGLLAEWDR